MLPNVAVARAWVSPLVNNAEPWARGSKLCSPLIGLTSVEERPSDRLPVRRTISRNRRTNNFFVAFLISIAVYSSSEETVLDDKDNEFNSDASSSALGSSFSSSIVVVVVSLSSDSCIATNSVSELESDARESCHLW